MRQVVRLDAGSRRLEFHTTVDWHESHTLLKVCFPLAVRAPNATYEMPFGYAERPTHYSTSFDRARYEVPGHRFADLSEHGFGAAVLTDSKYGYSCYGGDLRVSPAALAEEPRPRGGHGPARVRVRARPARRRLARGGDRARGRALQRAASVDGRRARSGSFASVDDENLVLDTIKRAEDSDAIVLRLYEPHGGRGVARVRLARAVLVGAAREHPRGRRRRARRRRRRDRRPVPAARGRDGDGALIVCVGLATRDTIYALPRHPGPDERVVATERMVSGGGPAATAAVAIARLGVAVRFVGVIDGELDEVDVVRMPGRMVESTILVTPRRPRDRDGGGDAVRGAARGARRAPTGCTSTTSATTRCTRATCACPSTAATRSRGSISTASTSTRRRRRWTTDGARSSRS